VRTGSSLRWDDRDQVGLVVLGLVIGWLVPAGAPIVVAIDDTLFRRRGRKVHAACWAYDGSRHVAAGQQKLSRGSTFVVAAVVVRLPFLDRPIALPVLTRLWRPGGQTKTTLARELIDLIATARRDRSIQVVADSEGRHAPSAPNGTGADAAISSTSVVRPPSHYYALLASGCNVCHKLGYNRRGGFDTR
jgi:hypothetical protein